MRNFIPVTENAWDFGKAIQWGRRRETPKATSREFRILAHVAENSHMAHSARKNFHVQGFFILAPSGQILATGSAVWDADRLVAQMQQGLARWRALPESERFLDPPPRPDEAVIGNSGEDQLPKDGLVLQVVTRGLSEAGLDPMRNMMHPRFFQLDSAWFHRQEMLRFVPPSSTPGNSVRIPQSLLRRIAILNLAANPSPLLPDAFREASLTSTVMSSAGDRVRLRLEGHGVTDGPGKKTGDEAVGFRCRLLGHAEFDRQQQRFVVFELVALGMRTWGSWEARSGTPNPLPMGVYFRLADTSRRIERQVPFNFDRYAQ